MLIRNVDVYHYYIEDVQC